MICCSVDARSGVRKRDSHHPTDVFAPVVVPEQMARSQGFLDTASGAQRTQTPDAGLLSDHVVAQPRYRHTRGTLDHAVVGPLQRARSRKLIVNIRKFLPPWLTPLFAYQSVWPKHIFSVSGNFIYLFSYIFFRFPGQNQSSGVFTVHLSKS